MSIRLLSLCAASIPLIACTGDGSTSDRVSDDEGGVEDAPIAEEPSSLPGPGAGVYLRVTAEQPCSDDTGCSGLLVSQVNRDVTTCPDGAVAPQCRVIGIDWLSASLTQESIALVNAALRTGDDRVIVRGSFTTVGDRPMVAATAAWLAAGSSDVDGALVLVRDTGVRCITTPCLSWMEIPLNGGEEVPIAGIDFTTSGASQAEIAAAESALAAEGVIVAGRRTEVTGPAGSAPGVEATRFWLPAGAESCYVGGCSGQLCTDAPDAVSTCEWRPEYACYQTAQCARQTDGQCGWTPTPSLEACLASPPAP